MNRFELSWGQGGCEWQPGGHGPVTRAHYDSYEMLRVPETSNGFVYPEPGCYADQPNSTPIYADKSNPVTGYSGKPNSVSGSGSAVDLGTADSDTAGSARAQVRHYRIDVPRGGTYRAELVLSAHGRVQRFSVFAGRRRCVMLDRYLEAGVSAVVRFAADVSDIVPRGKTLPAKGESVDITVISEDEILQSFSIQEDQSLTRLFVAGDSTVTDQPADIPWRPAECYCGWGQMLPLFLREDVAVSNHAHSGLTTESFRQGGHWDIIRAALKTGDIVAFQFGHNDQKLPSLGAASGYSANLRRYIEETRSAGAVPVIVSPVSRNLWNGAGGAFNDLLQDWALACRDLSRAADCDFVDLHAASLSFVRGKGRRAASAYFHPDDYTHHNDYGGRLMASFVAQGLKQTANPNLRFLVADADRGDFAEALPNISATASGPDGTGTGRIPMTHGQTHSGSGDSPFAPRGAASISRAEFLSALLSAFKIMPAQVYNEAYKDLFGDEWYAGGFQTAHDLELFPETMVRDGNIGPGAGVTRAEAAGIVARAVAQKLAADPNAGNKELDAKGARAILESLSDLMRRL